MKAWHIFQGSGEPHDDITTKLPPPPHWRNFEGEVLTERKLEPDPQRKRRFGAQGNGHLAFKAGENVIDLVNTALYLRRPLLVKGKPGVGKSTLAHAVAYELKLGPVLSWPITSRSSLQDALYRYDAIERFRHAGAQGKQKIDDASEVGRYIRLGPVGTALLPSRRPRVLLIDEIDKSDIDLPNDLLNIFEEGEFEIPELARLTETNAKVPVYPHDGQDLVTIQRGHVICNAFPFVVITSNGERELPKPFLRRCLQLEIDVPSTEELAQIVESHFGVVGEDETKRRSEMIKTFIDRRGKSDGHLATDQLLNAIYLVGNSKATFDELIQYVLKEL